MKHVITMIAVLQLPLAFSGCRATSGVSAGEGQRMSTYKPVIVQSALDAYNKQFPEGWWDKSKVNAGPHAHFWFHLRQMQAAGWKEADLDTIVAVSGASALLGYEEGGFMPKYAFHHVGVHDRIAKATGFGYEYVRYKDAEHAWSILKESLDSGRPVSAAHAEGVMLVGYQDAEDNAGRKVFAIALEPEDYGKWWTWKEFENWSVTAGRYNGQRMGRHTERVPTEPPRTVALRVMRDLVSWSTTPPERVRKAFPKARWGLAAVESCAEHCADVKGRKEWGFCHNLNSQWPTRKSTATYLRSVATEGLFPEGIGKHLMSASENYRKAYDQWVVAYRQVSWGGPKDGSKRQDTRSIAAEALRKASEFETAAINDLKAALALID
ncbi:MAG: hypothetical protein ACYTFI_07175 [Planctomycetota bacterium]